MSEGNKSVKRSLGHKTRPKSGNARLFWDYCARTLDVSKLEIFFSRDHSDGPRWVGTDNSIGYGMSEWGAGGKMRFIEWMPSDPMPNK